MKGRTLSDLNHVYTKVLLCEVLVEYFCFAVVLNATLSLLLSSFISYSGHVEGCDYGLKVVNLHANFCGYLKNMLRE